MTQTPIRPKWDITLTAMQSPEAGEANALSLKAIANEEPLGKSLLLRPGEPAEIVLQILNLNEGNISFWLMYLLSWAAEPGLDSLIWYKIAWHLNENQSLYWKIKLEGNFPENWCEYQQSEFAKLDPKQQHQESIYFRVPADFFENQSVLQDKEKPHLQLNYQCEIAIYRQTRNCEQAIEYTVFQLQIRPNSAYLDFLPAIYREVDFVGRFLSIFECGFEPTVQTLDTLWAHLDPLTAPTALLPFLAHWVGWNIDTRWDIDQQRRLIRNAITLYRWHGTRWGLRFYLHLYTRLPLDDDLDEQDKHIQIIEDFKQGFVLGKTNLGNDSMLGGGRPYHFIVKLRQDNFPAIDESLVRQVIESQKPAFSTYDLQIL
jgi:phage tail-like protein